MSSSRRHFLTQVSGAATLGLLARFPGERLWAATPADLLAEPDKELLRELALAALEAARTAGAGFADVRVATGREVEVRSVWQRTRMMAPAMSPPNLLRTVGYGIRAIVDGAWGFATGYELTPDGVRRAARAAVARARANRPRRPRTLTLAPTPVRNATWTTPIEQDPFAVPLGEQADRQLAAIAEAMMMPDIRFASAEFIWRRSDRVFASTDGALLTQHLDLALPFAGVGASTGDRHGHGSAEVDALARGGYGYEAVSRVDLIEEMRRASERASAEARRRTVPVPVEVGRYDLVFAGSETARLLARTLAEAINAERVLGYRANHEGTSFAAPPDEVLGTLQVGSPLLTVHADRTRPHGASTVGWDDEGAAAEEFTVVRDGVLMDYLTTRQTAAELAPWYRSREESPRSHGCASGAGQRLPSVQLPNLTLEPGPENLSVDDLIADTARGFYLERLAWGRPDQQVLNAQYSAPLFGVREIRNGKLGHWVQDFGFQFITPQLWRNLDALGGSASIVSSMEHTDYWYSRDPIQLEYAGMSAVPARFREVNVLNTGRTG